jgi:hypothetical protein
VVAGLRAGAGASTLAAALHGVDAGVWSGGPVDVLVARAGRGPAAVPPGVAVLVLVGGDPAPAPGRPGEPVVLPVVPQWSGPEGVRAAAGVLRTAEPATPVALRPAAAALCTVVAALLRSGVLDRPGPSPAPAGAGPAPAQAVGPAPVAVRRSPVVPVLLHRAVPVRPRLVAGAPLRWARSGPTAAGPAASGAPEPGRAVPSGTELGPAELRPAEQRCGELQPVPLRTAEPRAAGPGRTGPVDGLQVPAAPLWDGLPTPLPVAPRAAAGPAPAAGPARAERPHPSPDAPVRARTLRAGLVPAAGRSHDGRPVGARRPDPALWTG